MTTTQLQSDKPITQKLRWIDGFTLYSNSTGTIRIYEFDGTNQHDIMPSIPGQAATLSQNGKYMYTVSKDKKGATYLSRVTMVLN